MVALKTLSFWSLAIGHVAAIWPEPSKVQMGSHTLFINKGIDVTYNGDRISFYSGYEPSDFTGKSIVQGGVSRAMDAIFNHGLYPWMFHPRNETKSFEPSLDQKSLLTSLEITQNGKDNSIKPLAGQVDESYELKVNTNGKATISAETSIGVLRALETFSQLFYTYSKGRGFYTPYAPVDIKDAPQFTHRGIMLDTARVYYSVNSILRTIDGCAISKLNVLHLHITDAQSWPLEIPAMPELSGKGAYGDDLVYTPDDIRKIQEYGIARGVQVILEMDQPGHMSSVAWSHPDLVAGYEHQPYVGFCAEPPCGQLRLNNSDVDKFLDRVMDDLLPRLNPYVDYFHNGGDEIKASIYKFDPSVGTSDMGVIKKLLQKYSDKAAKRVRDAGLTPMVWEEIPVQFGVNLGDDVVVQSWLGGDSVSKIISGGNKVIDSNYNYLYLDCGHGQWLAYHPGPSYKEAQPFLDWCDPYKGWERVYSYNPVAGIPENDAKMVIGSEAAIWSEMIDETKLDLIAWPRASVLGEILWTGPLNSAGRDGNRTQITAAPRINELRERMVARGIQADRLQMTWCTMGGNCVQPVS